MNPAGVAQQGQALEFTGRGGEYFRIWIVNLALTILTLGIYSAWAKVRRLQYFYRNTSLYGSSFDYHGDPIAILKGRLIGVGLLVLYNVTLAFNIVLGLVVFLLLIAALPWLLQRSLCFKLVNSSYRGVRFSFAGSVKDAYAAFLAWPFLGYITAGLLMPLVHQRIKTYQHSNSLFGTSTFSFSATPGPFYGIYLRAFIMFFVPLVLLIVVMVISGFMAAKTGSDPQKIKQTAILFTMALLAMYLILFLLIYPYFAARMQNLVWNHTMIGPHHFASGVRARDLLAIFVTNLILIILTLGLFKPFADIRLARYRLQHIALQAQGSFDEFFAHEQQAVSATGTETANVFDVDISF